MPKDETFWNPYRLISIREGVQRKAPITDEKFKGRCGIISCSLENLTPLFVGKNRLNPQQFLTRRTDQGDRYVIPGSSLKGMLRSLGELVGGGCFITGYHGPEGKQIYEACSNAQKMCITCRMFGMMEKGKNAEVHRGNVSISDALLQEEKPETQSFHIQLSSPKINHEPFYRSPNTGILDGKSRKLYFHQPNRTNSVTKSGNINALLPGHHFDFDVQFSNLSEDELNLLLFVIVLEDEVYETIEGEGFKLTLQGPLRHKIGNAKPLGLGSCYINIKQLKYFADPKEKFTSLQNTGNKCFKDSELTREISSRIQKIKEDKSSTMEGIRKMMIWDEKDPRNFRYPDHHWFDNSANSQKPLKKI